MKKKFSLKFLIPILILLSISIGSLDAVQSVAMMILKPVSAQVLSIVLDLIDVKVLRVSQKPWVDVTAPPYNAKGDGVTDDTAAIRAAYAATQTGGLLVFPCPPVYYRVLSAPGNPALTIDRAIRMLGLGSVGWRDSRPSPSGVRIRNEGTGTLFYIHNLLSEADQVIIEYLRLEGNALSQHGIDRDTVMNSITRGVFIGHPTDPTYGHGGHGLMMRGASYYNKDYDLTCLRNAQDGVHIEGDGTSNPADNTFFSPRLSINGGRGIFTKEAIGQKFYSPSIEGNVIRGIEESTNSLDIYIGNPWYEGNGDSNTALVNPGYHPSGSGTYIFDGGHYPAGGIHSNQSLDLRVTNADIAILTLDVGTLDAIVTGTPWYCVITDNTASPNYATILYKSGAEHILKMDGNRVYPVAGVPGVGDSVKWDAGGFAKWAP